MNNWKENFKKEFGVHFKGSSGELGFAIAFIEDELRNQIPDEAASVDLTIDPLTNSPAREHPVAYQAGLIEGWNACRDKMLGALKE